MCTVTVVPGSDGYIFTFSRDESPVRYTPHFAGQQKLPHKEIFFAADSRAGGTWFAADSRGNIAMLFNGAFNKHERKNSYAKSRGIILLELFMAAEMRVYFENESLAGIEPFSVILFERENLYRLTWDGEQKHITVLLKETSYIFSSVTLYDEDTQAERRRWLAGYLKAVSPADSSLLLDFHKGHKKNDAENGLIIKRPGSCSTLSISQAVVKPGVTALKHIDLVTGQIFKQQILTN